jgi:hypothetical protein
MGVIGKDQAVNFRMNRHNLSERTQEEYAREPELDINISWRENNSDDPD